MHAANHILLLAGIILAAGSLGGIVARRFKAPDVVLFLLAGILLGPEMAGLLDVRAASTFNQVILVFGSCYILFDGGASLKLGVLKDVWITILTISTVGVLITAAITGVAAAHLLGIPLRPRCCSALPSPPPIRQLWCRFSRKCGSRSGWHRPSCQSRPSTTP